jgi:hypothetical protein
VRERRNNKGGDKEERKREGGCSGKELGVSNEIHERFENGRNCCQNGITIS